MSTNADWATLVLSYIGAPTTNNNVQNMLVWMAAEEPSSNWWNRNNPLNTGFGTGGGSGLGSAADLTQGAQDTASTINQSNMSTIKSALLNDVPLAQFEGALQLSPWAGSHYSNGFANPPIAIVDNPSWTSPGPQSPLSAGITSGTGTSTTSLSSTFTGIANLASLVTDPTTWKRVGLFIGGLILLMLFAAQTGPGRAAKHVTKKAAELGVALA